MAILLSKSSSRKDESYLNAAEFRCPATLIKGRRTSGTADQFEPLNDPLFTQNTPMKTLEELELRKKELELRRDIARLERNERLISRFDPALIWAIPLIASVSFVIFLISYNNGLKSEPSAVLGVLIGISLLVIFRRIRRNREHA